MAADNPFWDFSLAVYRKPGVAEACLRLQNGAGADVNLLLYFCWLATVREAALADAEVRAAVDATEAWRAHVVQPLREVRRWMKGGAAGFRPESAESLRTAVKRVELESERLQQDLLFRMTGPCGEARAGAETQGYAEENIARYFKLIGVPPTAAIAQDCRLIAAAAIAV